MNETDTKIIKHTITHYLSRREHSYRELIAKLCDKGFDEKVCHAQLQRFVERDIQSDVRFTEMFVRSAFNKGKGPSHIKQALFQHNIDDSMSAKLIYADDFDWYSQAVNVLVKKFGNNYKTLALSDYTLKQKQMRFLQYRGFEQDQINEAFSK